jgi:very-short-patch-repair endonuclease
MSTRPYFNTGTQELARLFEAAASQQDLALLKALANELKHRDRPAAQQLKREVKEFLKAQKTPRPHMPTSAVTHESLLLETAIEDELPELTQPELPVVPTNQAKAPNRMTEPHIIERLKGLLEYVRQTAYLKGKPSRQVEQHGNFKAYEHELLGLPGIHFDTSTSDDDTWLRVERLHESKPPAPRTPLLAALIAQSNAPLKEPGLASHVTRAQLSALGVEALASADDGDPEHALAIDTLTIKEQLQAELETYTTNVWQPWADKEKEVRKTISKYADLFASHQMLQGNLVDSPLELVLGVGLAVWELPDGKLIYPLISQLVELSIDEHSHAIEVRPRSLDARLELDVFTALDNPGVAEVARLGKEHFKSGDGQVNPFVPSTFEPVLKAASSLLDSKGAYWPSHTMPEDRQLPKARDHLLVTDTWVLFVRPRTSSLFVQDLERFEALVETGVDLDTLSPATLALLADPSQQIREPAPANYRGLSNIDRQAGTLAKAKDLFFPMPYNDEQVQIVHMLDHQDGVVVQGPPGTGKTHTIANVISHYLALGKRVLVTSMKDPALAVLQEKLPAEIRPLAISLLSSEADGMKQFEHAIRHIAAEVSRINKQEMRAQIDQYETDIDRLHAQIARTEYRIGQWAKVNLESISLDGDELQPLDIAREVAGHPDKVAWIADTLTIAAEHAPQFGDADILSLRNARMALAGDLSLLQQCLPSMDAFPEPAKLQQAHLDLGRLVELNAQVSSETLPPFRDIEQATIEEAMLLHTRVFGLRESRGWLDRTDYKWLPELERQIRKADQQDALLRLLFTLRIEIRDLLAYRTQFVARPLAAPEGLERSPEMVEAIDNLSQGRKPFGLAGLFGKSAEKKLIEQIRIVGKMPEGESDWTHVLQYLRFLQDCSAVVVRWDALAQELHLPVFGTSQALITRGTDYLLALDKLQHLLREENAIAGLLQSLLPTWQEAGRTPYDCERMGQALEILDDNLTRNRLTDTLQVKQRFIGALAEAKGEITDAISTFLHQRLGNSALAETELMADWTTLMTELRRQHNQRPHLQCVREASAKIEASGAPKWAQQLRTESATATQDTLLPDNWKELWRYRRLHSLVESMDGRAELALLSKQRSELEKDLSRLYQKTVTARTWLKMAEKATPMVRSALEAYRVAISRIGRGTGVRAPRYRKDARDAAAQANPAIPCWIMPHYRISESLPVALGEFDLVIIDEASQSDLTAMPALLRAKKVLIVGDDQQVSPEGVGLEEEKIRSLMGQFLGNQVGLYRPQMSPDKSIYDLFKVVFAQGQIMLREHFRCVGPIIEYSKREFYNHELRPLRMPLASERMDPPLIDVHVIDGHRGNGKTNKGEALFILEEIRKIVDDQNMSQRSIGVVSLLGSEQAQLIWTLVVNELGEDVIQRHQMAFGDARTFQGKERDIVFLSMVDSGRAQASSQDMFRQRYNVAASRARDRMYLVRSITQDELSKADKLRSSLMQHFQSPYTQNEEEVSDLRDLCESPFEREVFDALVERGYRVQPQVKVGSYRIDLVVEGERDARLAIECDGDRYHGPDQWDHDMRRQRVLERAGWHFWRCFASNFVLHREALLTDLTDALQRRGIEPVGSGAVVRSLHSQNRVYEAFPVEAVG